MSSVGEDGKTIFDLKLFSSKAKSESIHMITFQSIIRETGNLASTHQFAHVFVNGENWV